MFRRGSQHVSSNIAWLCDLKICWQKLAKGKRFICESACKILSHPLNLALIRGGQQPALGIRQWLMQCDSHVSVGVTKCEKGCCCKRHNSHLSHEWWMWPKCRKSYAEAENLFQRDSGSCKSWVMKPSLKTGHQSQTLSAPRRAISVVMCYGGSFDRWTIRLLSSKWINLSRSSLPHEVRQGCDPRRRGSPRKVVLLS